MLAMGRDTGHACVMAVIEDTCSPKRRAILAAATGLFAARGYGAVSMDAIAREADVSKATLYAHFASKDALFATIVNVACQENILPGQDLPEGESDVEAGLLAIGRRILRFFLEEQTIAMHRLVVAESVRFPELGRAFFENGPLAVRQRLARWLSRQTALSVPDPEVAAEQFLGMLRSGLYTRVTLGLVATPGDADLEETVVNAVNTFLRAFRAPP